jgi:hypothetical protein
MEDYKKKVLDNKYYDYTMHKWPKGMKHLRDLKIYKTEKVPNI